MFVFFVSVCAVVFSCLFFSFCSLLFCGLSVFDYVVFAFEYSFLCPFVGTVSPARSAIGVSGVN